MKILVIALIASVGLTTVSAQENPKQACNQEQFQKALEKDVRYVPLSEPGETADDLALRGYFSLTGDQKVCAENIVLNHINAVLQYCQKYNCGENIGGGCAHLASKPHWVYEMAFRKCSLNNQIQPTPSAPAD